LSAGWLDGLEEMDHGCTQGQMVSEYILTLKVVSDVISSGTFLVHVTGSKMTRNVYCSISKLCTMMVLPGKAEEFVIRLSC
jgi:hypothetical protein